MKKTIFGIKQEKLVEYNFDSKDVVILDYLKELMNSNKIERKIVKGEEYFFLDYHKLIKYLPILKINNVDPLGIRISKFEKLGLLTRYIHKVGGTFVFLCLRENFKLLFENN